MIHNARKLLRSGLVLRWHQNPDMSGCRETNAEHQWSVAMLVLTMEPEASRDLLIAALTHDAGEIDVGDLAFTSAAPEGYREMERDARAALIDIPELSPREHMILAAADRISAYHKMMQWNPSLAAKDDRWTEMLHHTLHNLPREIRERVYDI